MSHIFWIYSTFSGQKKKTYIISQKNSRGKRNSEREEGERIWWTVYNDLATSTEPDKTDEVQNFSHVGYSTLQSESLATGTGAYLFHTLGIQENIYYDGSIV
jgi:hypothetical protein